MPNVAGGEDAWATGLERVRLTLQRPIPTRYIAAGQHEAVIVEAEDRASQSVCGLAPIMTNTATAGTSCC